MTFEKSWSALQTVNEDELEMVDMLSLRPRL
jgi:hypothetical protein